MRPKPTNWQNAGSLHSRNEREEWKIFGLGFGGPLKEVTWSEAKRSRR
jgi:hypothetical protein